MLIPIMILDMQKVEHAKLSMQPKAEHAKVFLNPAVCDNPSEFKPRIASEGLFTPSIGFDLIDGKLASQPRTYRNGNHFSNIAMTGDFCKCKALRKYCKMRQLDCKFVPRNCLSKIFGPPKHFSFSKAPPKQPQNSYVCCGHHRNVRCTFNLGITDLGVKLICEHEQGTLSTAHDHWDQ